MKNVPWYCKLFLVILAILCVAFFITSIHAQVIPSYTGYVNDFANVINAADKATMTNLIKANTKVEIAVVTVPDLQGYSVMDFAVALGKKWGVGKKDNKGVVLLLALKERKVAIATGYGIEGILTDAVCKRITEEMKPVLKSNNFSGGLVVGVKSILQRVK